MLIVFAVSLLISYCSFTSLILLLSNTTSFYIYLIRLIQKCKKLYNAIVGSLTKKEYRFAAKSMVLYN